ncbi:flagellar motor switch protein FliM [Nocardioides marmoribigeumensis]|uniref:Flagellar motor switch protein FliM n=1 Tax=Nocardioides marmoribigeumensis TaxID=433649 RepID=A0ABU2BUZ8_9ACTN|nr:flagellar motor switch protein FliM [Nocardioides marmoribigeumensis]MDR7362081.1 flagellar motor switch protein FliM [Nocardioides marmoribigeumensis]
MTDVVRPGTGTGAAAARARRRSGGEPIPYDFRRPIQLSREHARILQLGLDGFAKQATTVFTSTLRTVCSVSLSSIEQQTYSDYVQSLGPSTYMTIFKPEPINGAGILEMPVQATMVCVDHLLGGPGSAHQPDRPLSEIEGAVVGGFVQRLLGELRYSLEGIVAMEPQVTGVEYSPQFAQAAAAGDIMVVASFDLRIGDRDFRMTFTLPFSGLHPHLLHASAPITTTERERAQQAVVAALLQEQFQDVPLDVRVRLRHTSVAPEEVGTLAVGDVIRLAHPAAAPLDVTVDEVVFAHATPGTHGRRLAAQIVAVPQHRAT